MIGDVKPDRDLVDLAGVFLQVLFQKLKRVVAGKRKQKMCDLAQRDALLELRVVNGIGKRGLAFAVEPVGNK